MLRKNQWTRILQHKKDWIQIPEAQQASIEPNVEKALSLWQRTLDICQHAMGKEHAMTQSVGAQVAHCQIESGQYTAAEKTLGTYTATKRLASLYLVQGKWKQVEALDVYESSTQKLEFRAICKMLSGQRSRLDHLSTPNAIALEMVDGDGPLKLKWQDKLYLRDSIRDLSSKSLDLTCLLSDLDYSDTNYPSGMESLTTALREADQTDTRQVGRILYRLADGYHRMGEAVTSEGLFTTSLEHLKDGNNMAQLLEYANALDKYQQLLRNWEKRENEAKKVAEQQKQVEQRVLDMMKASECKKPLFSFFDAPFLA